MTKASRLRDLLPHVIRLYWKAQSFTEERIAYRLMIALGVPPAYGESSIEEALYDYGSRR